MWLCLNDGFYSVVQHRDNEDMFMVRARAPGHLEALLGNDVEVIELGGSDYRFRSPVSKIEFLNIMIGVLMDINYDNFKNSVEDRELHNLYGGFWQDHFTYQNKIETREIT